MIEIVTEPPAPYVGARVRWHTKSGTNFGRVLSLDTEAQTVVVQAEDSPRQTTLGVGAVTVLSGERP